MSLSSFFKTSSYFFIDLFILRQFFTGINKKNIQLNIVCFYLLLQIRFFVNDMLLLSVSLSGYGQQLS